MLLEWIMGETEIEEAGIDAGMSVEVSGNPDRARLRGVISTIRDDPEQTDAKIVRIMMADGQPGAQDLQEWIESEGEIGVLPATHQNANLFLR